jgi:hypothetical protein
VRALALALLLCGCDGGAPAIGCAADVDCPPEHVCRAAACIGFAELPDAQVPDLGAQD